MIRLTTYGPIGIIAYIVAYVAAIRCGHTMAMNNKPSDNKGDRFRGPLLTMDLLSPGYWSLIGIEGAQLIRTYSAASLVLAVPNAPII